MNYKLILWTLGRALRLEALCLVLPLLAALYYHEDPRPFLLTILPAALLGTALARLRVRPDFYYREGFAVVGLVWVALSLFGALPFRFSGQFGGYIDCPVDAGADRAAADGGGEGLLLDLLLRRLHILLHLQDALLHLLQIGRAHV